ncbi:MAG: MYXO-CTERM sorting domain-containing protein [Sandaracinaceae bacterium]|nr:MYXO-CTERM sorting domain-containing protein [Sandaracinaceae bacterium]
MNEAGEAYGEVLSFVVPEPTAPMAGGCGCRAASPSSGGALPLAALALLVLSRRRRARRGSR